MRALKVMLAYSGFEFVARGIVNYIQPTTFYLQADAPRYAQDAVRVLAITYLAFGLIHLGAWRVNDRPRFSPSSSASWQGSRSERTPTAFFTS